jgi:hypothetical protein
MTRPNLSGASVSSLEAVKGRPLGMSILPVRHERRNLVAREAIVKRIVGEFQELPGLVLSLKQASRLLGVDEAACGRILTALTKSGVLRRSANDYYSRREPGI